MTQIHYFFVVVLIRQNFLSLTTTLQCTFFIDIFQEVIRDVDTDKLRSLVLALIDREPGLVFDLCENADLPNSQGPTPPVPLGGNAPSLCRCGHCREMGTDVENKCCGCLPRNCVSTRDVSTTVFIISTHCYCPATSEILKGNIYTLILLNLISVKLANQKLKCSTCMSEISNIESHNNSLYVCISIIMYITLHILRCIEFKDHAIYFFNIFYRTIFNHYPAGGKSLSPV